MDRSSHRFKVFLLVGIVAIAFQSYKVAAQDKTPSKLETAVKRHAQTTDEELRKQLQLVSETGFDQTAAEALYEPIVKAGASAKNPKADLGPTFFGQMAARANRTDQLSLPWHTGIKSEMGKEAAQDLHELSINLRDALRESVPKGGVRPDPDELRKLLTDAKWTKPQALPSLTQMMQAENTSVRLLLVELLGKIKGTEASIALAKRAVFDLSPEVREKAIRALADRPATEYTPVLYGGLRYPWPAAADHAAEALAALQLTDLVPELVKILKEPNPNLPYKDGQKYLMQEVVRINHLCNCMLCHAPSQAKDDLVRGRVPLPNEDPPPLYYQEKTGIFVRADLTYLRQDFSVVQPVPNAGKWSGHQRYDYLLRTRPLTKPEQNAFQKLEKADKLPKTYPQQGSVLFALRELTGKDYGSTYEDWVTGLQKSRPEKPDPQKQAGAGEMLPAIIDVTAEFDQDKKLTVTAIGQVPTGGWKDAKLIRREAKGIPQDGIYEYEMTAVRPTGNAPQGVSEVKAVATWENPPAGLKGIRVLGAGVGVKSIVMKK